MLLYDQSLIHYWHYLLNRWNVPLDFQSGNAPEFRPSLSLDHGSSTPGIVQPAILLRLYSDHRVVMGGGKMRKGHSRGIAGSLGLVCAVLAAGLVVAPARAQNSPFEGINKRFESTAPQFGEPLPDVPIYDLDGTKHLIRDLVRGQYTVLVLGCLT
jgi:hypothetical protein